jgi:hypothetical protein
VRAVDAGDDVPRGVEVDEVADQLVAGVVPDGDEEAGDRQLALRPVCVSSRVMPLTRSSPWIGGDLGVPGERDLGVREGAARP